VDEDMPHEDTNGAEGGSNGDNYRLNDGKMPIYVYQAIWDEPLMAPSLPGEGDAETKKETKI